MKFETRTDWLKWRKNGIGGSEAASILKLETAYSTPLGVYEDKITPEVSEESGYILDKGNAAEIRLRAYAELKTGLDLTERVIACADEGFEFLFASLDGATEDLSVIAEIKLIGAEPFKDLKENKKIVDHHYAQCQHNLMVSNATKLLYIAKLYSQGSEEITTENVVIQEVFPDKKYQKKLIKAETDFWYKNVIPRVPPKETPKDYKHLPVVAVAKKYNDLKEKIEKLELELQSYREEILERAKTEGHNRYVVEGLKINHISKVGSIDYKKIPVVQKMTPEELEPFRGAGSQYWQIK